MAEYLVDSNFFIQASRYYYPLDIATGFWSKVKELANDGKLISIDKVQNELEQGKDELWNWCVNELPANFFKPTRAVEVVSTYAVVVNWAQSKSDHFLPKAIEEFMGEDEADAWLVAYANAHQLKIVTYEVSAPLAKARIKIPEACSGVGATYCNPMEMFRALGVKF
jgi:hypothetical protein